MFSSKKLTLLITILCGMAAGVSAMETSLRAWHNMLETKSATPVASGEVELRLGLDYTRHIGRPMFDNNWGKTDRQKMRLWDWRATATYGLDDSLDVFVSAGWFDLKDRAMPGLGIDKYGRGLTDMTVGLTVALPSDNTNLHLAYIPELVIPIGRDMKTNGRIGLGRDFWEFVQTLAATMESENWVTNANLSHSIPFGGTRSYYSTPFMMPNENVRGITAVVVEALYNAHDFIKPMANLSYSHEWISGGNDSDLVTGGLGMRVQVAPASQVMVGYDYPIAGRNSLRAQTWNVALVQEF